MKKLKLNFENTNAAEFLTRDQLKNIIGGSGGGGEIRLCSVVCTDTQGTRWGPFGTQSCNGFNDTQACLWNMPGSSSLASKECGCHVIGEG